MNGFVYDAFAIPHEPLGLARLRAELLSFAKGKTLELCAGTGLNFKHYPQGIELIALELHPSMRRRALERAKKLPASQVQSGEAENLPFENDFFDTVVVTLGLCSVDQPELALQEAYRVLKPDGIFLVMEHFRKNTQVAGKVLDLLTPGWKRLSGGCHLNRHTDQWITESPFKEVQHRKLWGGYGGFWVLKK